LRDLLAS
jgi:hypothetical protein